jgi:hypothetical protein
MILLGNTRSSRFLKTYKAKCCLYNKSVIRFSASEIKVLVGRSKGSLPVGTAV